MWVLAQWSMGKCVHSLSCNKLEVVVQISNINEIPIQNSDFIVFCSCWTLSYIWRIVSTMCMAWRGNYNKLHFIFCYLFFFLNFEWHDAHDYSIYKSNIKFDLKKKVIKMHEWYDELNGVQSMT